LFVITQHPMLIDTNVRRLVGNHKHVTRKFGWSKAVIFEFESCKDQPLTKVDDAIRHDFVFPKASYDLYKSAEVHTHKPRIPFKLALLVALPILIVVVSFWEYSRWKDGGPIASATKAVAGPAAPGAIGGRPREKTKADWLQERMPRIEGMAATAPVYDEVTKPVRAPYPAACVDWGGNCRCYTTQATKLDMEPAMCREIVASGYFVAWNEEKAAVGVQRSERQVDPSPAAPVVLAQVTPAAPTQSPPVIQRALVRR
jgi:hypothetical protein